MEWAADYKQGLEKYLYYEEQGGLLFCGDCLEVMKGIPDSSVDLLATDPPYGLKFMGKSWDKAVPSVDIWKECLRVLKPGAFAFVLCIPRQDCLARMIVNLADAGFEVSFTSLYHTFATGFPKAGNVGKMVDRRLGLERISLGPLGSARKTQGTVPICKKDGDGQLRPIPVSPQAKALDGSYCGFQPKPAIEVVLVAMKPLSEKTYIDQAMANGKGITWLDSARIPYDMLQETRAKGKNSIIYNTPGAKTDFGIGCDFQHQLFKLRKGRFPANLLVSDDVLNDGRLTLSKGGNQANRRTRTIWGKAGCSQESTGLGDSGSYSRYFSLDAWWAEKIKQLPQSVQKTFPFLIVPKAGKKEKGENNRHPTVKPLKLMSYLVTLGSRQGDIALDPFLGSGTTAVAAVGLRRRWIGIELNPEFCQIILDRLDSVFIGSKSNGSEQMEFVFP